MISMNLGVSKDKKRIIRGFRIEPKHELDLEMLMRIRANLRSLQGFSEIITVMVDMKNYIDGAVNLSIMDEISGAVVDDTFVPMVNLLKITFTNFDYRPIKIIRPKTEYTLIFSGYDEFQEIEQGSRQSVHMNEFPVQTREFLNCASEIAVFSGPFGIGGPTGDLVNWKIRSLEKEDSANLWFHMIKFALEKIETKLYLTVMEKVVYPWVFFTGVLKGGVKPKDTLVQLNLEDLTDLIMKHSRIYSKEELEHFQVSGGIKNGHALITQQIFDIIEDIKEKIKINDAGERLNSLKQILSRITHAIK